MIIGPSGSKRVLQVVLLSLMAGLIAGCGFKPLYGRDGASPARLAGIYVEPIADRTGYELRNTLIDLLDAGDRGAKNYSLKIVLQQERKGIALQTDASITRYNVMVNADYALRDATGKVLKQGRQSTLTAYNVVSSPYATLTAEHDAQKRAAEDLAYRIQLDLGVFFARHKNS